MKDLDQLKRETTDDLRHARGRREVRDARARRDGPILDAYDRMARSEPVPYTPGPTHAAKPLELVAREVCPSCKSEIDCRCHEVP